MPLQDLTPQLRTRLSRLERVVALFVGLAVLLLLTGLGFFFYRQGQERGWFKRKLPYFTFVRTGSGLKVGDRVRLMGFDAGEVIQIEAEPPEGYYNVFVAFRIWAPYYGYLWTNSSAKIVAADFLGHRYIEVTKGTNYGAPTYLFHEFREIDFTDAADLSVSNLVFGQAIYAQNGKDLLAVPYTPLSFDAIQRLTAAGVTEAQVIDKNHPVKRPAGIWNPQLARYERFPRKFEKGYFLQPQEATAVADRLERLADTIESAVPNILGLTNELNRLLTRAADATDQANRLLEDARPTLAHVAQITGNLTNSQGALGDWLFTSNFTERVTEMLGNANTVVTNTDARLEMLTTNLTSALSGLDLTLENLANITSNLHAQVNANTNMVSDVSRLIIDADNLVQGLKRHWLLRSAFKEKPQKSPPQEGKKTQKAASPKANER
jgi:ABC-type transporter Mla subunit MlaD